MIAESFVSLLTDPAHWGIEVIAEGAFFAIEILILDRLFHWHRERTHFKHYRGGHKINRPVLREPRKPVGFIQ